jgi:type IVB pilus formation R64 PilN family outer membrane protein
MKTSHPIVRASSEKVKHSKPSLHLLSNSHLIEQVFKHFCHHPQFFLILQNLLVWLCVALLCACTQIPVQPKPLGQSQEQWRQKLNQQAGLTQQHFISTGSLLELTPIAGSTTEINQKAQLAQSKQVAKYAQQVWVGKRTMALQHDANLPALFTENISIQFSDATLERRISLALVAERLSRVAKIAIRLSPDVYDTLASTSNSGGGGGTSLVLNPLETSRLTPQLEPGQAVEITPETKAQFEKMASSSRANKSKPASAKTTISYTQADLFNPSSAQDKAPTIASHQMRWEGSLQAYLDHITQLLNLSWRFHQGAVVIERFVTENFELAAFAGSQDYQMGLSGGNQGNGSFGSSSAKLDVQESGKTAVFEGLRKSLETIVTPSGGLVNLNEASGRITVQAPKDVLAKAREIIQAEQRQLQRQAHIQLDIYSVSQQNNQEYGVDWSVPINDLAKTWTATIASPVSALANNSAGLAYTLLKDIPTTSNTSAQNTATRYGGSKAFIKSLQQLGQSVQYRPVSLIAMNRQWARSTSLRVTGYVSETTPSTSSNAGSGAPGLKTASVTTGDKFLVQPAIMDNGTIYLKFGVSLTDLLGLFNVSAGSGDSLQTVQTPETSGIDDQGSIRLSPGEAMIITGLSRQSAIQDQNKMAEPLPLLLGGSQKRNYQREDFLIIVRATPL